MGLSGPVLRLLLSLRRRRGKEDGACIGQRTGKAGMPRPAGKLLWFHAASVGEAQSTLALIDALGARDPAPAILVTTGTVTSATLMGRRLPPGALHQYYPLDNPRWVAAFLDHWKPDAVLWMESELWPSMLGAVRARGIPAALVNARLSEKSFRRWRRLPGAARHILSAFRIIVAQTDTDAAYFSALGGLQVVAGGNLKYSAAPLPADEHDLAALRQATDGRSLWLYASTHEGEEDMACRIHERLKGKFPGLLTVIVPRHPERGSAIAALCESRRLAAVRRGTEKKLPADGVDLYIADTLGELGLFYRLAPLACIGRSFSSDGGGGHNPLEAAQLGCAVLHGPAVQNLAAIFHAMNAADAALEMKDEAAFAATLETLLADPAALDALRRKASAFAQDQDAVIDIVLGHLEPLLVALHQTDSMNSKNIRDSKRCA